MLTKKHHFVSSIKHYVSINSGKLCLQVVLTNGLVNLTLSIPDGMVTGVTYKGSANLLNTKNKEDNRGSFLFY